MQVTVLATVIGLRLVDVETVDRLAVDARRDQVPLAVLVGPGSGDRLLADRDILLAFAELGLEFSIGIDVRDPQCALRSRLALAVPVADHDRDLRRRERG